ncbi:MAG: family 78 glycoside hydrolase catalytic domain [Ardenticatenaceae bacterium]|nr:family 78 glycoside hydrolase catalytic domain [Ardenticatenaceae bacterium]MCB9446558.1 family 78 glycoside hydrolase catalytic domain [Ardenticatenaceae bacterium]
MPTTTISNLTCEYQINPLGIDVLQPQLSWQMQSDQRGVYQTAYQIVAASSEANLASGLEPLWDSGKVESDQSIQVAYGGPMLASSQRIYWKVWVWDEADQKLESPPAWWEMGLLSSSDWQADWITPDWDEDVSRPQPCPLLRRTFDVATDLVSARVYATSLGLYELRLNGQRVGDAVLTPGWTSYQHRLQYQTYDVTGLMHQGDNVLGAILGDGWYRGYMGFTGERNLYGDQLALLVQLKLVYGNGRTQIISSDDQWRATPGPIQTSDIYKGEIFDARLEKPGWDNTGYDDSDWQGVRRLDHPKEMVVAQVGPLVRRHEAIRPLHILHSPKGETILDFGQNMVGWVKMRACGPKGTTITLRHAEVLDQQGNLYTENLRIADQIARYTLQGLPDADEQFEPHFTFYGFRFVSVEGFLSEPTPDDFTAVVLHSDTPPTGTFECSNPLINQLQHNIVWGQKGNFVDVPTDCPQRDERLGWTGDAQVFIRTACFNMDVAAFFTKWLRDLSADQLPNGSVPFVVPDVIAKTGSGELSAADGGGAAAWGDAAIICPWTIYRCYGDKRLLAEQYESMAGWVDYMRSRADEDYIWRSDFQFGDWLDYRGEDDRLPTPVTNNELIATAFYAYSARLLADVAQVLGKVDDAACYTDLAHQVTAAFNNEFVTPAGRIGPNTQTAYVLALHFDLLPESARPLAAERLAAEISRGGYHLTTGFVGTPYLCHVLSRYGYTDVAYKLLNQEDCPSWLYPVKQGATTIWERWDGIKPDGSFQDAGMNSFNHYAYGAVGDWLYQVVAGIDIDPDVPGYKRTLIQPQPGGGLTYAKASLDAMYGRIKSKWTLEDDMFQLEVTIPANSEAVVHLPAQAAANITEQGQPLDQIEGISEIQQVGETVVLSVSSGQYCFAVSKN